MQKDKVNRRTFVKVVSASSLAASLPIANFSILPSTNPGTIKVGVVGTGNRGTHLMRELLAIENVEISALCDLHPERLDRAIQICQDAGQKKPEGYTGDEYAFRKLMEREDLDAVIIATYWEWHAPMAVYAMKHGKYAGVEVPAALSLDECWELVNTSEETGVPCMMLENWSFRKDNLAVLNMIRNGLLGDIVHCHAAHSHDCIDHWFFDAEDGHQRWGAKYLLKYNRDQYPTHGLGPVLSWMDINCDDRITQIYSCATASTSINAYFKRRFGNDHPNANLDYKQGDIVTSTLRTKKGKSIIVNYDMQLPRPYDNRWMIQGTKGIYNEQRVAVHLVDRSPAYHEWEPFRPYEEEFLHKWWKDRDSKAGGHGGVDSLELELFVKAVQDKTQTPLDVYDSVTMSAVVPLSGLSIEKNQPVEFPDFTRGRWKGRATYFAM